MNSLWQRLLGMQRSPGAEAAGETRLEFTALPKGAVAVGVVLAAVALLAMLWWLYRRESRDLSPAKRGLLVGLRTLTIAAIAAMLVEPVLISSHKETVKSRLAIVLDDSESMRFADPYTDDTRAVEIATALKLPSEAGRPPVRHLRETTRLDLVKTALRPHLEALARGREVTIDDLESAAKNGAVKAKTLDALKPSRPVSPVGDALGGALANLRGQAVAGVVLATDGRSNTGEDPMRAAEAAVRQNVPIYLIAAGGDEGPRNVRVAEVEASPVVFAKDPMTLGRRRRGTRPEGRRGDPGPRTTRQPGGMGDGLLAEDPPGRGRHPQEDLVPDHTEGGRRLRVPRPRRGRRPRIDPRRQRRHRRRESRPAADPAPADRRRTVARGPVPPQRADARPARRVRRLAPARRPRIPPGRRPSDHAICRTTRRSFASTTPCCSSIPT